MLLRLSWSLMILNAAGGAILLKYLYSGEYRHLGGLRWLLWVLAFLPIVGMAMNVMGVQGTIRQVIGYAMIGSAVWGFIFWLHAQR